jgi:hypothetical protein
MPPGSLGRKRWSKNGAVIHAERFSHSTIVILERFSTAIALLTAIERLANRGINRAGWFGEIMN